MDAFGPYRPDRYTRRRAELILSEKVKRTAFREDLTGLVAARPDGYDIESADPFALATLDFGIAYETAVLEWFEQLAVLFSDQQEGTAGPSM